MNAIEPHRVEKPVPVSSDREFGLVMAAFMAVIAIWPYIMAHGAVRYWAGAISVLFLLLALFIPQILNPLNRAWGKLGEILNKLIAPVVMLILFFGVVTPIAMLMRLTGKRPLDLKYKSDATTYWIQKEQPEPDSMKRQF